MPILLATTLILAAVIVWLLWATLQAKGSVNATTKETNGKARSMSAELYVETFRSKRNKDERDAS